MTLRSMTGYGAAAAESETLRAAVAVRSLNHRFLEIATTLPRRAVELEPEVRGLVQARVRRGKVEVSVRASFAQDGVGTVVASKALVASLVGALRELKETHRLEGNVQVSDVARFPGALEAAESVDALGEDRRRALLGLVATALDGLEAMRRAEGARLARELERCLDAIEAAARGIETLSQESKAERLKSVLEKARGLLAELGLEEARLYQEVARLADRLDVSEELQRLRSHAAAARELLASEEPAGKRLDFLAQEMAREANTAGSKAASAALVREVVGLKGEIEKLREQVQNVE